MGPVITRSNDVISGYQLRGANKRQVLIIKNHYRAYIGLTVSGFIKIFMLHTVNKGKTLFMLFNQDCYSCMSTSRNVSEVVLIPKSSQSTISTICTLYIERQRVFTAV